MSRFVLLACALVGCTPAPPPAPPKCAEAAPDVPPWVAAPEDAVPDSVYALGAAEFGEVEQPREIALTRARQAIEEPITKYLRELLDRHRPDPDAAGALATRLAHTLAAPLEPVQQQNVSLGARSCTLYLLVAVNQKTMRKALLAAVQAPGEDEKLFGIYGILEKTKRLVDDLKQ